MAPANHFKIWKVTTKTAGRGVTLRGQFDKLNQDAVLQTVEWLANPVKKNDEAVGDPKQHLVGYSLKTAPAPKRWVILSNQFHKPKDQTLWHLGDLAALLVPASKVYQGDAPQPPTDLDHYACYVVEQPQAFAQGVVLEDQFDVRLKRLEKIAKLEPAFFGVPVSKNGEKLINVDMHLALYDIAPKADSGKPPIKVITRDQFGVLELTVEESLMLAVPSEKLKWAEGKGP
ncbi:MAG TPA: hypothetical protein VMR17_22215 [Xanthobacteraceae bacterium]|jgi:hypothetical protein|nr:hypothetical protein [Xanthobacteraceae bacterium]